MNEYDDWREGDYDQSHAQKRGHAMITPVMETVCCVIPYFITMRHEIIQRHVVGQNRIGRRTNGGRPYFDALDAIFNFALL
jgi:hypothetical protein